MIRKVLALAAAFGLAAGSAAMAQVQPARLAQTQIQPGQLHMGEAMASLSAQDVRRAALESPLFLDEIDHASLVAAPQTELVLAEGVTLDLSNYLRNTRIIEQPVASLALANPQALGISGQIDVVEDVFVLEDRIIVSREVTVPVSRDTCSGIEALPRRTGPFRRQNGRRAEIAQARSELCLRPPSAVRRQVGNLQQPVLVDPAARLTQLERQRVSSVAGGMLISPPTEADIAAAAEEIRAELRAQAPTALYRHDVRVGEALNLPDSELLRLDADGDERVITHVSIIPLTRDITTRPEALERRPQISLPDGEGFLTPVGPRVRRLPNALAPHAVTRRGSLQPGRRFTGRVPTRLPVEDEAQSEGRRDDPRLRTLPAPRLGTSTASRRLLLGTEEPERRELQSQRITQDDRAYFITGFTLHEEIEERHKVTFNRRRNYFVAFKYRVGYRAGLRFPFEVDYGSTTAFRTDADSGSWNPTYATFDVSATGVPAQQRGAYAAAGMPSELIAGDREFTFGVWAWCQLQVRLPVIKTVRVNCPSISVPPEGRCPNWACADFTPPIDQRRRLAEPRVPADVSGLQINAWVARAGVEPGVNIYAADARFSLLAAPVGGASFDPQPNRAQSCEFTNGRSMRANRLLSSGACRIYFDGTPLRRGSGGDDSMQLSLNVENARFPGLELSEPRYEFTMEFVPVLDLFAEIDIAVASWRVEKEIEIPGLAIRRDFRFDRHRGTTDSVTLGGCSPLDTTAPGCSRRAGYQFGPVQTFREGDPG